MAIHPAAVIDAKAELDSTVEVGPHAVIEGPVRIGANTRIYANAYISGWTTIGAKCEIHPGAVVGHLPQDFHFEDCRSYCEVGDGTIIREFSSVHRGTQPESSTVIGKGCFIMGYSHIGHNCVLADGVKFYNMAAASGHVEIGRNAIVSGYTVIHQFVRIGEYCMIGGLSRIGMDVPPFFTCLREGECIGINAIGMRRSGFEADQIGDAKNAYRVLYRSGTTFRKAVEALAGVVSTDVGRRILEFVRSESKRGFTCGPRQKECSGGRAFELPDGGDDAGDMET
ncbi:MAG: acyl-ACP--UDP-N-acetylglucosamine O-acyltransferase [Phycisphaerae bacterium]|nr:acyl-ACP--UDP-N-acetylglucosamine O-acyltransferase [Phycisphaerae bacterium]